MKKLAKLMLFAVCVLCLAMFSVGCDMSDHDDDSSPDAPHTHVAESTMYSDSEYHWQKCECGEIMNKTAHSFTELVIAANPAKTVYLVGETFEKQGMKVEGKCVCGNIEITDYTVEYQTEGATSFAATDTHVVVKHGELSAKVSVTVGKIKLEKPAADVTEFVYNGSEQTYTVAENERYTVSGNKQTNAGTYKVTVALNDKDNVSWADDTTDDLTYTFVIGKLKIEKPAADETKFVYNGSEQTYTVAENERYTVSGNKQTNAGTYKVTVALNDKENVSWADDTDGDLTYTFVIGKLKIEKPAADVTEFVYNGSEQTYTVAENERYTVSGNKQTNAGTYKVTVALNDKENVSWADDTDGDLTFDFVIAKAANAIEWAKDEKGDAISLDVTYPAVPAPQATAISKTAVTFTFADNDKSKTGSWAEVYKGAAQYYCIATVAESDNYLGAETQRLFTAHKAANAIEWAKDENGKIITMDITYPAVPNPQTAIKGGTATYTYSAVEEKIENGESVFTKVGKAGDWATVATKPGVYYCIVNVAESDNYLAAETERLFRIYKADNSLTFELKSTVLICGEELDCAITSKGGDVTIKYSRSASGEFKEDLGDWFGSDYADLIGNGKTYYAKAFVKNATWYNDAQSEARSFVLNHDFENGVCKSCGYAQTGIQYAESGEIAYVTGYAGNPSTEVYVCATYNNKPVTYVAEGAFNTDLGHTLTKVVLPESVTELKGCVFLNCYDLEYVDMRGVTKMSGNNNFLNCDKLKTVIIGNGYQADDQQFVTQNSSQTPVLELFVNGKLGVSLSGNDKLVKSIYYKVSDDATVKCMQWKFGENGEIVKNGNAHNYGSGICTVCGGYDVTLTQGVSYGYSKIADSYYVEVNKRLNVAEVTVLGFYNDGEHGEKSVTFVKNSAFAGNPFIKKVTIPENVTTLDGGAFLNCENLEYVSMTGVVNLDVAHLSSREWFKDVYAANDATSNNFLNCKSLKTLVVGGSFKSDGGQFGTTNGYAACVKIYTLAASDEIAITLNKESNALLTGEICYYSATAKSGFWYYDENGNVKIYD